MAKYSSCNKCGNIMEVTGLDYKPCDKKGCDGYWQKQFNGIEKVGTEWPAPGRPLQVAMNGGNMKRRNT